jgi:O-succinylbenzoic acid--CoA ligase
VRTSGSTGEPKDVLLSASALMSSARATLRRLGGPGSWTLALPPQYVAGLQVIVRSVLADRSPVVLSEHPDLAAATAELPAGRRYVAAVPTQLYRWLNDPVSHDALGRYDAVLLGGAAAADQLLERARSAGIHVVTTYGMSETAGGCVYDGLPLDGVAVALSVNGDIRVAGPMLFDGYLGRPELTATVLRDGWLHTPDVGRLDQDGRLEVLGRSDDIVTSGGVNVALPAVERIIRGLPGVASCTVLGVPDREWGARVVAFVSAGPESAPDLETLRDAVAAAHPRCWAPQELVLVEQIPLLANGKVDRQSLLRRVGSHV